MTPELIGLYWLFIFGVIAIVFLWLNWVLKIMDKKPCATCGKREGKYEITVKTANGKTAYILVCKECFRELDEVEDGV